MGTRTSRLAGGRAALIALAGGLLVLAAGSLAAAECRTNAGLAPGAGLLQFAGGEGGAGLEVPEALGVNPLFTWAELEPAEGAYNWAPLDRILEAAGRADKRVAPRVYTNLAEFDQGTPDWVFAAGAAAYVFEGGSVRQPVPTDAVFTEKFGRFVAAFGARYNGHPDIEFVQTNAGMGGYGEMVWDLPDDPSPEEQIATSSRWIDRWRSAFPDTPLALMVNFIGHDIGETLADRAVDRGFYLQANSPDQPDELARIFRAHASETKIILEIENNGCRAAAGPEFDAMMNQVFGYGFPIDYLTLCEASLHDAERMQALLTRLRRDD